jgi:hypothetical protein
MTLTIFYQLPAIAERSEAHYLDNEATVVLTNVVPVFAVFDVLLMVLNTKFKLESFKIIICGFCPAIPMFVFKEAPASREKDFKAPSSGENKFYLKSDTSRRSQTIFEFFAIFNPLLTLMRHVI